MIQILKELKIDTSVISTIVNIYSGDKTHLKLDNSEIGTIDISSGIRQGCNGSALLFVLITYKIIEEMKRTGIGFRDERIYVPSLFYMDDGLIITCVGSGSPSNIFVLSSPINIS